MITLPALRPQSIVYIVYHDEDGAASIYDGEPCFRDELPILLAGPMSLEAAEQIAETLLFTEGTA